jgi:hypothetical protein
MQYKEPAAHEAIRSAMADQRDRGFLIGHPRVGYKAVRTPNGTVAVPVPKTAPLVAEAFIRVAVGASLRSVTAWLQEAGLKGVRGGAVSMSTVQRMLTDPYYAGMGKVSTGRYRPMNHEPLVSLELFSKVQKQLFSRRSQIIRR